MSRRSAAALLASLPLALCACKAPEQKLMDRKHELRDTFDRLYADYGGGEAAQATPQEGLVGRVFGEIDRSYFEEQCLAVGRGDRPFSLSGKLDAFLKEPANARACRKAADLALEVAALEREVGAGR